MKHVAFVNENMLGHGSYLRPYVRVLLERPELGIVPHSIDAAPLPPGLSRWADTTVKGLRRWGLDFYASRWRIVTSRHVRHRLDELRKTVPIEAVVINTQSVGLDLTGLARKIPVFVALDATFEQLAGSGWFAPNRPSRWFQPLTLAPIRSRERRLFDAAHRLLPWSEAAKRSLLGDYGVSPDRVSILPPSLPISGEVRRTGGAGLPQILFVGGDFRRKGGEVLRECHQRYFADRCDFHIVTESQIQPGPGIFVHHGVSAYTEEWRRRWAEADIFVFPSTLDTFGIVLLEALAFGVPVIAADVGAARDVLRDGEAGVILSRVGIDPLREAIETVLRDPEEAHSRAAVGREHLERHFNLDSNAERLAEWLIAT